MGLDNGIILKQGNLKNIPFNECSYDPGTYTIAYWRKCWGIRNEILEAIGGDLQDSGTYELSLEHLQKIIDILKSFNNKQKWDTEADSIWEYEDFAVTLKKQIRDVSKLIRFKEKNPEAETYFYDSW